MRRFYRFFLILNLVFKNLDIIVNREILVLFFKFERRKDYFFKVELVSLE